MKKTEAYSPSDLRYLQLLARQYPTVQAASTEIINLQAIMNLPKGTEHFISDIHGEYEAFLHILNSASGVVREKIDELFESTVSRADRDQLATLIYYPAEKLEELRDEIDDMSEWYRITLHRLIEVCRLATSKYTRSKVRKALPPEYAYIIDELLNTNYEVHDKKDYYENIINTIIDLFDYYSRCENTTASDSGSDEATDDEFYELMRASMDAYSTAGPQGGYVYIAKRVSTEIADVVANSPVAGTVDLYVLMDDGTIAQTEVKNAVLAACSADTVRPLTDLVSVKDPETVEYDISFTYYIPSDASVSSAEIEAAVDAAVKQYVAWQCGKLGRDINPSYLIGLLMQTGIKRVDLTSPTFTVLKDGSNKDTPQVATVGDITATNGGYEDE